MFSLDSATARLASVNPRAEIHGDETVAAADLGITLDLANDVLSHFGPRLREALFMKAPKAEAAQQGELEAVKPVSDLPHLRNQCIEGALRIAFEGVGYTSTIGYGLGEIALRDVRVTKVRVTPKEGGTVSLGLQLQVTRPDAGDLGRLCQLIGNEITITLEPPKAEQKSMPAAKADAKAAEPKGKGAKPGDSEWPFPQQQAAS